MARIRWGQHEFTGDVVHQNPDGSYRLKMKQEGPRWAAGTHVDVPAAHVIEMAAAEMPETAQADIETEMAKERETLPTPQELIAQARKDGTVRNPKPAEDAE